MNLQTITLVTNRLAIAARERQDNNTSWEELSYGQIPQLIFFAVTVFPCTLALEPDVGVAIFLD